MRRLGIGLLVVLVLAPALVAQGTLTPVAPVVNTVYQGTTPLVLRSAVIDFAATDQVVINESAGQRICVVAGSLTMTGTTVTIRFESTGGGTALTGPMQPLQGHTIVWPFNPACWLRGDTSQAIGMELSGTQSVDGVLIYAFIDP